MGGAIEAFGPSLAAFAGGKLGQLAAGGGSSKKLGESDFYYTPNFVKDVINPMLDEAMQSAIQSTTGYTQQGTAQINKSLQQALETLNKGLTNANSIAQQQAQQGFNTSQNLQTPQRNIGYSGTDAYAASLGLTPNNSASTIAVQESLKKQQAEQAFAEWQKQMDAVQKPGDMITYQMGDSTVNQTRDNLAKWAIAESRKGNNNLSVQTAFQKLKEYDAQQKQYQDAIKQLNTAKPQAYATPKPVATTTKTAATAAGKKAATLKPAQVQAQQQAAQKAAGQQVAQTFFNTPGYQVAFGKNNDQASPLKRILESDAYKFSYGNNKQADPLQRFYNSAAYQQQYGKNNAQTDPYQQLINSPQYKFAYGKNNQADPLQRFFNSADYKVAYGDKNAQIDPMQRLFNSAEYKTLFGSQNATQQAKKAAAGTYNPVENFQAGPAFQYNMDEALRQVNMGSAAKGLLESGATQRDLLHTAQGLQNNEYDKWLNRLEALQNRQQQNQQALYSNYFDKQQDFANTQQANKANLFNNYFNTQMQFADRYNQNQQQQFSNYQNQLGQLTNFGAGQTGNQNAFNMGNMLSTLLSGNYMNSANSGAGMQYGAGQDIASLLANLGIANAGLIANTAAAKGNNIFQGNTFTSQILGAQRAAQAQAQSSLMQNQGNQQAMNSLGYGAGTPYQG
jgi:hypothetical protein